MKKMLIPVLSLLLLTVACGQQDEDSFYGDDQTKAEASQFVDSLMTAFREGRMDRSRCPAVRWIHIPALLEYGKSTKVVGDDPTSGAPFQTLPSNPLSSFLMPQCLEGMFALWMVEAARINTLYDGNPPERKYAFGWPSMNAFVQKTNGEDRPSAAWLPNDETVQKEVLEAYQKWWKEGKGRRSAAAIDPLEGTGYKWH